MKIELLQNLKCVEGFFLGHPYLGWKECTLQEVEYSIALALRTIFHMEGLEDLLPQKEYKACCHPCAHKLHHPHDHPSGHREKENQTRENNLFLWDVSC